jgi:hypothetical protein
MEVLYQLLVSTQREEPTLVQSVLDVDRLWVFATAEGSGTDEVLGEAAVGTE